MDQPPPPPPPGSLPPGGGYPPGSSYPPGGGYPPGGAYPPGNFQPPPPNYMVWAVLSTVLCCLPFGIVSIVFASQVNSKAAAGDYQGALQASKNARTWALVAFGAGLLVLVIYVVIGVIGVAAQHGAGSPAPSNP